MAQMRRVAASRPVNARIQQFHNGTPYDWPTSFRVGHAGVGKQDRSIAVSLTFCALSGGSAEHNAYLNRMTAAAIPNTHVGASVTEDVKLNWKSRIEERWSAAWFVAVDGTGDPLEQYKIEFDFTWVTDSTTADYTVVAVKTSSPTSPADGTINTLYWGVDDGGHTGAAIAHEFGHLIGNPDEYGTCTFKGRNATNNARSIMCDETNGTARPGHFWLIGKEIAALLNTPVDRARIRVGVETYDVSFDHPWL
ncbi:hypothetical protein RNZ50_04570 [Paracoccaceae bacterium Fryx2]|nr:hypothetical protein [Paracoccaceae bacterium Fryx2]